MIFGRASTKDDDLLREIRSNFKTASSYWKDIYNEGDIDVKFATKGPWDETDLTDRAGRPTLVLDELGQYLNQLENQARQNKRAVKVNPDGDGATDQTALVRSGIIRGIEYKCKAQQAYVGAFGDAVRRSFGFFKLTTDFERGSLNRVIKVVRIPNPKVIYLDPDAKEADWSDCEYSFEIDGMREKPFVKRWPKAEIRNFTPEHIALAPGWITSKDDGKYIQVASYCKVIHKTRKLVLLENGRTVDLSKAEDGTQLIKGAGKNRGADAMRGEISDAAEVLETPDGTQLKVIESRDDDERQVTQYVTNGVEILESNPLDFKEVPLIPVFGKEVWVTIGGVAKREFHSQGRMARGAYKAYCYVCSGAMERLGQDPKTPYEGYEGQFDTITDFQNLASSPVRTVEFKGVTEATGSNVLLPLPHRNLSEPQIGQYLTAAELFRRAIQAAMGGSPLPTAAQRNNEKSGVALERIENSTDEGNFHFVDNFNQSLERCGRMMDDALDTVYSPNGLDGRQVPFNDEVGEHSVITINKFHADTGEKIGFHVGTGNHGVTISTGPSSDSQRDEAQEFTETLVKNPHMIGPAAAPKILAKLVKLRNLGPIGDQIAEILDPQDQEAQALPMLQQQVQSLTKELQDVHGFAQGLQEQIQSGKAKLDNETKIKQMELDAKHLEFTAELEVKKYVCDEQEKTKRAGFLVKVNAEDAMNELEQELNIVHKQVDRVHDVMMASHQAELDQQAATQAQEHANAITKAQQQHEADLAQGRQEHDAALQNAEQQHQVNLQDSAQAADQAAQPTQQ